MYNLYMKNIIIQGDSLIELPKLKDNSVNIVITSPPYNMNLRVSGKRYASRQIVKEFSTKYKSFSDNMPMEKYFEFNRDIMNELLRITDGLIFYNVQFLTGNKRALFKLIGHFSENLKEVIIWNKGTAQPAMAERTLNSQYEVVLVLSKDDQDAMRRQFKKANFSRGTLTNLWDINRGQSKNPVLNSATMPKALVEKILDNFGFENCVVLDPFAGTGTTLEIAKEKGYNSVGIELDEELVNFIKQEEGNNGF